MPREILRVNFLPTNTECEDEEFCQSGICTDRTCREDIDCTDSIPKKGDFCQDGLCSFQSAGQEQEFPGRMPDLGGAKPKLDVSQAVAQSGSDQQFRGPIIDPDRVKQQVGTERIPLQPQQSPPQLVPGLNGTPPWRLKPQISFGQESDDSPVAADPSAVGRIPGIDGVVPPPNVERQTVPADVQSVDDEGDEGEGRERVVVGGQLASADPATYMGGGGCTLMIGSGTASGVTIVSLLTALAVGIAFRNKRNRQTEQR